MRALKFLVAVMGVLIVAGTVALVVMIVQRAGKAVPAATGPVAADLSLRQPPGTRIAGIAPGAEGRLAVWVQRPDGERLVILDTRSGAVLGEIRTGD